MEAARGSQTFFQNSPALRSFYRILHKFKEILIIKSVHKQFLQYFIYTTLMSSYQFFLELGTIFTFKNIIFNRPIASNFMKFFSIE